MVADLRKYRELRLLDRFYMLPPLMLAVSTYLLGATLERLAPGLNTNGLQMLAWGFFVSTVLVHHGVYCANSIGHLFGGRRFDTSNLSGGGTRWTSAMRSSAGFVARHPPGL